MIVHWLRLTCTSEHVHLDTPGAARPQPICSSTSSSAPQLGPAPAGQHQHGTQAGRQALGSSGRGCRGVCSSQAGRGAAEEPATLLRPGVGGAGHGPDHVPAGSGGDSGQELAPGGAVAPAGGASSSSSWCGLYSSVFGSCSRCCAALPRQCLVFCNCMAGVNTTAALLCAAEHCIGYMLLLLNMWCCYCCWCLT
jgi:hypothetical protein